MGVKRKAAAAIVVLLLCLGSLWLHSSLVQPPKSGMLWFTSIHQRSYNSTLTNFPAEEKLPVTRMLHGDVFRPSLQNQPHQLSNSSEADGTQGPPVLAPCPGQKFQVSELVSHLLAARAYTSDVLLQPYLSSWEELVKFMESLGPMVSLISQEIESKTAIIRQLALLSEKSPEAEFVPDMHSENSANSQTEVKKFAGDSQERGAYHSVRSMIWTELNLGTVDFHHQTESGCRTLLRLHRALLWLKLFLQKLAETPTAGRLRSPSDLCREAYQNTLSHHHTWFVRRAAELAFIALPERGFFFRLVCVQNQEELSVVLTRVVNAIGEIYDRTQKALEENGMLDLP